MGASWRIIVVLLLALWFAVGAGAAERRVALLIGNSAYDVGRLSYPGRDVREMEAALKAVGFDPVRVVLDADQKRMKRAIQDFGELAQGVDLALVYYSGHGTQSRGENYLIPLGAQIRREADYELEAVSANALLRQIGDAAPRAAVVILDACRNDPVAMVRNGPKGLARMVAPTRTMVAFSTAPNTTADDNGVYAQVLARHIRQPGLELLDVFRNTTEDVLRLSGNTQEPRISEVSITQRIYLAGRGGSAAFADAVPTPPPGPAAGQVFRDCAECPEMVVIPAGRFLMGSPAGEPEREANEGPQRDMRVGRFALGKYEVSQGEWRAVMGSNPSIFGGCGDECPVEGVSWNDALEYVRRLSQRTGQRYRLPSEAEWEYAARAGTTTPFHTGQSITTKQANFDGSSTYNGSGKGEYRQRTMRVGSFAPNAFGLFDMHGNVWEWVQDCYDTEAYAGKAPGDGSAYEVAGCSLRALRGGAWSNYPAVVRSAVRSGVTADSSGGNSGFRLARMLP